MLSNKVSYIEIDRDREGQRIDNFLFTRFKAIPKSHIYQIMRTGQLRVNKKRCKPTYRLIGGDILRIPPLQFELKVPDLTKVKHFPLEELTLYEDKHLLIVNKPAGIAVHGGSGINFGVIESIRLLRPEAKEWELVHRLDRETSGCLMIAKKRSMLREIHELLRENKVNKHYVALLAGNVAFDFKKVVVPLLKNQLRSGERIVSADEAGKASSTLFKVTQRFQGYTLVDAFPETGRTHQIRVHAAHLEHPIVGDEKYGFRAANQAIRALGCQRLFLHAFQISLTLPDGRQLKVRAPLSEPLEKLLTQLSPNEESN